MEKTKLTPGQHLTINKAEICLTSITHYDKGFYNRCIKELLDIIKTYQRTEEINSISFFKKHTKKLTDWIHK